MASACVSYYSTFASCHLVPFLWYLSATKGGALGNQDDMSTKMLAYRADWQDKKTNPNSPYCMNNRWRKQSIYTNDANTRWTQLPSGSALVFSAHFGTFWLFWTSFGSSPLNRISGIGDLARGRALNKMKRGGEGTRCKTGGDAPVCFTWNWAPPPPLRPVGTRNLRGRLDEGVPNSIKCGE